MTERTLEQALAHAEEVREALPRRKLIESLQSDYFDVVLLADEVTRLRAGHVESERQLRAAQDQCVELQDEVLRLREEAQNLQESRRLLFERLQR
jgi:hypothetical protein